MVDNNYGNKKITIRDLQWDSAFFGLSCLKIILHGPLTVMEWSEIEDKMKQYEFITIENKNSEPENARLICERTSAFLADVNIQFEKEVQLVDKLHESICIFHPLEHNDQVLEIGYFMYSRFFEDKELASRGGKEIYKQWLINSFNKKDKYFAISERNNLVDGYVLFSFSDNICTIELIAVSNKCLGQGVGAHLFNAVEFEAYNKGADKIKVGTQVRNARAINFYHKVGCKQVGCHQIYHLHRKVNGNLEDKT